MLYRINRAPWVINSRRDQLSPFFCQRITRIQPGIQQMSIVAMIVLTVASVGAIALAVAFIDPV